MTDKNRLLRAIGDIDDKYITEILAEDAKGSGKVVKVPFNQKPVIKYMKYYLPAAAALVIVVACVKSGLFSGFGANGSASYDSAAPAATARPSGGKPPRNTATRASRRIPKTRWPISGNTSGSSNGPTITGG